MSTLMHYGQVDSFVQSDLIRETEAEDIRITEDGNIRITGETQLNISEGLLRAEPNLIRFGREAYRNIDGTWTRCDLYIKYNGSWIEPDSVYKNINGAWQRVY